MGKSDVMVGQIVELAADLRVAILDYQKPGARNVSRRWVEPYKLVESTDAALLVRGYQVRAEWAETGEGWKLFRTDRIRAVCDSGERFTPRTSVTIAQGQVHGVFTDTPHISQPTAQQAYADFVRGIVMDGVLSTVELNEALGLQEGMNPLHLRAAHGAAYASLLTAMLVDGSISDEEQRHLREVRECLGQLGWAP